ncbi:MAG: Clp protease N-terminal domain-containing protein [Cyanobacteriota bacterium]
MHGFTEKAIAAIRLAQNESRRLGHQHIGTEQILLGVIGEGTGIAAQVLTAVGVNFEQVQREVEKIIGRGRGTMPGEIPFTPRGKRALEFSLEASRQLGHHSIDTEHLLLGILRERDGLGAIVLQNLGVDIQNLEQQVQGAMS